MRPPKLSSRKNTNDVSRWLSWTQLFEASGENGIIISASKVGKPLARYRFERFNGSRHVYVRDCVLIVLNVSIIAMLVRES